MLQARPHAIHFKRTLDFGEGQREKIYDPTLNGLDPSYHRYHAEPFAGQEASCWEKHQMELEIARTRARAA